MTTFEKQLDILILEDSPIDAELTLRELSDSRISCTSRRAGSKKRYLKMLDQALPDAILADYALPHFDGLEALRIVKERGLDIPFILVTGIPREEVAVECMREGADDYILKSSLKRLPGALVNALERRKAERERRHLSEQLQKSVRQALRIFESITDIFIAVDEQWRLMYLNPRSDAFLARIGKSKEHLWGASWWDEFPMSSQSPGAATLRRSMEERVPVEFEEYIKPLSSWLYIRAYPSDDGLSIYVQDITERKATREMLEARERRFRAIIENSLDGFVLTDEGGGIAYVSPSSVEILGYDEAVQTGSNFLSLVHPDDRESIRQKLDLLGRDSGNSCRCEFRMKRNDGSVLWIEAVMNNMLGDYDVGAIVINYRDVTERRRSDAQLALQATVLNEVNDAIISVDRSFSITSWNRAAVDMYGWEPQEVIGRDLSQVLNHASGGSSVDEFRSGLETDGVWAGEAQQYARDGRVIDVLINANQIVSSSNEVVGYVAILRDVTEKKRLELQFLRAQRLESIGTLAGGIAHDLNNVFTPILMAIPMLKDEVEGETILDLLGALEVSASRGERIVRQVLSFARGLKGEKSAVHLKHIVGEVMSLLRETLAPNINLDERNAKDVWPVLGDTTQLYQIMMNLAVNARDAMPDGGTLRFETKNAVIDEETVRHYVDARPGRYVELTVLDTGTGIDPDIIHKIFDPFFTTKEIGKGTGLGLSTVMTIVRSHNGFVDLQSTVGKGTQFKIYLPVASEEIAEEVEVSSDLPSGNGERILIVDDEEVASGLMRSALESSNYSVITAKDGSEAVATFARELGKIDAVLLDMLMPQLDGPSTLRILRKMDPGVRVITMSGKLEEEHVGDVSPETRTLYLQKPFSTPQLLQKIARVLGAESMEHQFVNVR